MASISIWLVAPTAWWQEPGWDSASRRSRNLLRSIAAKCHHPPRCRRTEFQTGADEFPEIRRPVARLLWHGGSPAAVPRRGEAENPPKLHRTTPITGVTLVRAAVPGKLPYRPPPGRREPVQINTRQPGRVTDHQPPVGGCEAIARPLPLRRCGTMAMGGRPRHRLARSAFRVAAATAPRGLRRGPADLPSAACP